MTDVRDSLWVRILDVPAHVPSARTYATDGALVIEVHDSLRPDGPADGRFALTGGPGRRGTVDAVPAPSRTS